jgi:hypothetical protein
MRTPELRVTTSARSLALLATALVCIGCTAPAAQQSQVPSDTAAVSASASASTTAVPTPSATSEPSATPAPTLAFEPPDDILPPNSIVVVLVNELQLRGGPGLSAAVVGTASAGSRFFVLDVFGPVVADGLDWYRLTTAGDSVLWAAAGSGADRFLEVVPPDCPAAAPDLATLINMLNEWDRLACFGDRSLTLEGTFGCGPCDGVLPGAWEPSWLAYPLNVSFLWADFQAGIGPLPVRAPPEFELPALGSIVRVTGHFSDPASTTCTISGFGGELAMEVDPRTAELYCREQFVVDAMEVTGTDPNYADPYGG